MMGIGIVTGASSGFGSEFVRQLDERHLEEIWVIARRKDRLEELQKEVKTPLRPLSFDLTDPAALTEIQQLLEKEKPTVDVLVNSSGFGYFNAFKDEPLEKALNMIDLNDKALVSMCHLVLPFMKSGSEIINIASSSAFQPVPYIGVYAATKAFVLSFTRSLNAELRKTGIRAIAVCPHWTKTEFFDRAITDDSVITYYNFYTKQDEVVRNALRDIKKGKDVSLTSLPLKLQVLGASLLPKKWVMNIWLRQQKKL